jgi:hypothetical protein
MLIQQATAVNFGDCRRARDRLHATALPEATRDRIETTGNG